MAAGVLLAVMTVVAYLPATQCGFIWDDDDCVQDNTTLHSLDGLRRIWFESGATPYQYYPLVYTTYWIEYRLWGLGPTGYHVVNILLHAVGVVLLWRVLAVLRVPGAWVAAAFFALHPVHVESVAWITERKNVLSGVFYFAAMLTYFRYALVPLSAGGDPERVGTPAHRDLGCASTFSAGRYKRGGFYAASLVLFLCAMLSKTVTCTLPAVLLVLLWWKRKRVGRSDAYALAPFFALGIGLGLVCAWMEPIPEAGGAAGGEWDQSFVERCLIAGRALWFYAGKLLWPRELMFTYPRWVIDTGAWQPYLYPLAAIAVMAALLFSRRRIGNGPLVAVLCFAGTLFPALGFFDVYYMRYSFVADHWQYLASVGLIVPVVAVGYRAAVRLGGWRTGVAAVVPFILLAALGTLTWRQQRIYTNVEALWRDTLRKNPDAWMAYYNLGNELHARNRLDEAVAQYTQALRVRPTFAIAHNNLGRALQSQGKLDEAVSHYHRALEFKPGLAEAHSNLGTALLAQGKPDEAISHHRQALEIDPTFARAHYNLGNALKSRGRLGEAIGHYRQAVELEPALTEAHLNLANTLLAQGNTEEAIDRYRHALHVDPAFATAHHNVGLALKRTGRIDEAIRHLREAARLKPDWPAPLKSVAWILATHPDPKVRDARQAVELAERASELTGYQDARALDTLAAAYAATGRFDSAVQTAEAAFALAAGARADALANAIGMRLELYRQAKPYHEPARRQDTSRP